MGDTYEKVRYSLANPCWVVSRPMDIDRLEALEKYVATLVQAFVNLKEENQSLLHRVAQLQHTANVQKQQLERLQPERDELLRFRAIIQNLQREREIIRKKLEEMLITIERLEGFSQTDGKAST